MGDEVYQYQSIMLAVMHKLVDGLDFDFSRSNSREEREGITNQAIFVLADFLVVLRREEVFKLVLGEARDFMMEAGSNRTHPRVLLPLAGGGVKGETGDSFHFQVATARSYLKLAIGKWSERGLAFRERRGVVRGFSSPIAREE